MDQGLLCSSSYGSGKFESFKSHMGVSENGNMILESRTQAVEVGEGREGERLTGFDTSDVKRHRVLHAGIDSDNGGFSCLTGETITMRHINSAWRTRELGINAFQIEAAQQSESRVKYTNRSDQFKESADHSWASINETDLMLMGQAGVDHCQSFRRRKRKQGSDRIHRINSESRLSSVTTVGSLNASDANNGGPQDEQAEAAGEAERVITEFSEKVKLDWARVAPQSEGEAHSQVFPSEEGQTKTVGKQLTIGRSLSESIGSLPTVAGFLQNYNRAMSDACSWMASQMPKEPTRDLLGNAACELPPREGAAADEAFKLYQGLLGSIKDFPCDRFERKDLKMATLEEAFASEQRENQKLRAEVTALRDRLYHVLSFAEQGCKNCEYCQLIKEQRQSAEEKSGSKGPGECQLSNVFENCSGTGEKGHGAEDCSGIIERDEDLSQKVSMPGGESEIFQEVVRSQESIDELAIRETCEGSPHRAIERDLDSHQKVLAQGGESEIMLDVVRSDEGIVEVATREAERFSSRKRKQEGSQSFGLFLENHDISESSNNQEGECVYIDLKCGCTSQRYGDTVGILRVYKSGMLEIYCQCNSGCEKESPMTPASFEKHGGRGSSRKWKDSIWVVLGVHKVQFSKVKALDACYRRYKALNRLRLTESSSIKQAYHRDEFVQCKKCLKERRFRRRSKEECRLYHDASLNTNWECANFLPAKSLSCQDDEEREVRRATKGCIRSRTCQGCIECVCLGCFICRFEECPCRICQEFMANNT